MRKVKLLALLLAVLMVVTAFAGCANTDVIESDVANLDERVTALENLLNGIDKEIDDLDAQIKYLGDKIDSDKTADEVAALQKQLEEQKKDLEEQKAAAQAAKDAADAAAKAAKDAADAQAKANADLLQRIQELMKAQEEAEKEAAKVLADAKTAALAKIATREAGLAGKYADLVAAAKAAVNAATTENACDKAVTDLESAIAAADAAAGAAILAAAQKAASEEIELLREEKRDDKANYFADEYEAIVKALAAADTNVAAAKTKAEVDAAVATLKTELAKYVAVDEALYGYFVKLWNNLTEANRATNTELRTYIKKAEAHYKNNGTATAANLALVPDVTAYVYGKAADGSNLVVNLPAMFADFDDVYTKGETVKNIVFEAANYDELTANVTVYSLAAAVKEAAKLDQRIDTFVNNKSFSKAYSHIMKDSVKTQFGVLHGDFENWCKAVKPLSADNLALVTLTADVENVKAIIDNFLAAEKAVQDLGAYNYTTKTFENVFEVNGWSTNYATQGRPFYYEATKEFATDAIFAPIDAAVAGWTAAYKLTDADVKAIIYGKLGVSYENKYLVDRTYAKLMDSKYESFLSDIVPLVETMNAQAAIEVSAYKAYDALTSELKSWVGTNSHALKNVNEVNFDIMVRLSGVKAVADYVDVASNRNDALSIVTFDARYDTLLRTFFTGDYAKYKTIYADPINDAVSYLTSLFNDRKLYTKLGILAIRDEVVVLTTEKTTGGKVAYVDRDNALIATKKYTEGAGFESITLPTYVKSSTTKTIPMSIYDFKIKCANAGYEGLAETLVKESKLDELEAKFDARIVELNEQGADAFKKELAEVACYEVYADVSTGLNRTHTTTYSLTETTGYTKMYYVTLGDYAAYLDVYNVFETWVDMYGGNSAYTKVVDAEYKDSNKDVYDVMTFEDILGDGAIQKYDNMAAQFKVLTANRDALVAHFDNLKVANEYAAFSADQLKDLVAIMSYEKDKVADDDDYKFAADYNTTAESDTAPAVSSSVKSVYDLITAGFAKYSEFEDLNQNLYTKSSAIKYDKSEDFIKNSEADTWAVIELCKLLYVKAEVIAWFEAEKDGSDKDMAIDAAIARVLDAKVIYGMTAEAIEFSIEQYCNSYGATYALKVEIADLGNTIFDYAAKV